MNTKDLAAFIAVVDTGSIVAASARLNLTQPGVTRRIHSLEDQLGVTLLDRQSKPLKPTAAGHQAYVQGLRVLETLDELRFGIAPDKPVRGVLRLGITPYFSESALSDSLRQLRHDFPELSINVQSGWSPDQLERVKRGQLDVAAICMRDDEEPPSELVAHSLGVHPVIFVVRRDMDIAETVDLVELSKLPWIINQDGCGYRSGLKRRFDAAGLPFDVAVEALHSDLRLTLAAQGAGVAVVTPLAFEQSALREQLKILRVAEFDSSVHAWMIHSSSIGNLSRPVSSLRATLERQLGRAKSENSRPA